MNNIPPLVLVLAAVAAVLTTIVSLKALKGNPVLGNPVISVCVGLIAFIGLCECVGEKGLAAIAIPYVALALCLPITLFLLLFTRTRFKSGRNPSDRKVAGQTKGESANNRQYSPQSKDEEDVHYDDEPND